MKKLILYSFILAMANCNKYDDTAPASHLQVPPFTETGANTFGCLINGQVWANFGESYVKPGEDILGLGGKWEPNLVKASISFDNTANDSTFFLAGTYTLAKNGNVVKESWLNLWVPKGGAFVGIHLLTSGSGMVNYTIAVPSTLYRNIARNPFTVTIQKDSVTAGLIHIVSGTFSGMVYNYNQTDSLNIVGGVFDSRFP